MTMNETITAGNGHLRVTILGSGSSGNAAVISCGKTSILLDCGFSGKEIQRRIELAGLDEKDIKAILLSHEHGDHVQSAHTLSNRWEVPIYTTEGTFAASVSEKKHFDWIEIQSGHSFSLGDIEIHPITLPHDASDPTGFRFEAHGRVCAFMTDFGYPSGPVLEALKGSHAAIVEANHDLDMLRDGPYPWPLKQRVASRTGHLSNEALFGIFDQFLGDQTQKMVLAHISENNNHPGLLKMQTKKRLNALGLGNLSFFLAEQHQPADTFVV